MMGLALVVATLRAHSAAKTAMRMSPVRRNVGQLRADAPGDGACAAAVCVWCGRCCSLRRACLRTLAAGPRSRRLMPGAKRPNRRSAGSGWAMVAVSNLAPTAVDCVWSTDGERPAGELDAAVLRCCWRPSAPRHPAAAGRGVHGWAAGRPSPDHGDDLRLRPVDVGCLHRAGGVGREGLRPPHPMSR